MELLEIDIQTTFNDHWITGLCRTHFANHDGCRAGKLTGWIKKAGYKAHQSNGCVATDMPKEQLEVLIAKLEK